MNLKIARKSIIDFIICFSIFFNVFVHYFCNTFFDVEITYKIFSVYWLIIFFIFVVIYKSFILQNLYGFIVCCGLSVFSLIFAFFKGIIEFSNLNLCIVFLLAIFVTTNKCKGAFLSNDSIFKLCNTFLILNISLFFYILFYQYSLIVPAFFGDDRASWNLTGFFHHRNVFAAFLYLSSIFITFLFIKKSWIHLFILATNLLLIFCTQSRTSLVCVLFFYFIFIFFYCSYIKKIILLFCFLFFYLLFLSLDIKRASHQSIGGYSSLEERINMWVAGFDELLENMYIAVFGNCIGSSSHFLNNLNFPVSSFHNTYMQYIFENGFIIFFIILLLCIFSVRRILKSSLDRSFKLIWLAGFSSFALFNICEPTAIFFENANFSIISTIIFMMIPFYLPKSRSVINLKFFDKNVS